VSATELGQSLYMELGDSSFWLSMFCDSLLTFQMLRIPPNSSSGTSSQQEHGFFFLFIYSHVHTLLGSFLPPALRPHPLSSSPPPRFQAEHVLLLPLILLKRRHKHSKKDKVVLLVELRTAIQRDS
jgi:hypothetical protein